LKRTSSREASPVPRRIENMGFDSRKRKSWSDQSGVSEVVGNIMILMITVVLFSTIVIYVGQIPTPEQQTKTDFAASVSYYDSYTRANVTIKHVGGEAMLTRHVAILIEINDVMERYNLTDDPAWTSNEWTMGKSCVLSISGTTSTSRIAVTVLDLGRDAVVWTSELTGGAGGNPPSILQRYADSNWNTPTPDPVKEWDKFVIFVTIVDEDGDLNYSDVGEKGVWIDSSSIYSGQTHRTPDWVDPTTGTIFRWDFMTNTSHDSDKIDGAVVKIYAWDQSNHRSVSSFILQVTVLPTNYELTELEVPTSQGESGIPSYITYPSGRQGFGVYGENLTSVQGLGTANISDSRTEFYKDERVFIRVASLDMDNIYGENKMTIKDQRTNTVYIPEYEPELNSTVEEPFYRYRHGGSAQVFEAVFNTTPLPPGTYDVGISLGSSSTTNHFFKCNISLTINQTGSVITYFPKLLLYSDPDLTVPWGSTSDSPFNASGSEGNNRIYLFIDVQNIPDPFVSPQVEEIRMSDAYGDVQVYGRPPQIPMLGSWSGARGVTGGYVTYIDLRVNNGDQWLPGTQAYSIIVSRIVDDNEGVYSLSQQAFVTGMAGRSSFFVGSNGIYQAGGTNNFVNTENLFHINYNNFFTKSVLYTQYMSPAASVLHWMTAIGVGDFDGDKESDMIVARYYPSKGSDPAAGSLLYYRNTLEKYGTWQGPFVLDRARNDTLTTKITSISIGDVNGDRDNDFAYSTDANKVAIYYNTFGAYGEMFNYNFPGTVSKIALEDMTGDQIADLIVLSAGKVYVFDISRWTRSASPSALTTIPNPASLASTIVDFDIADVNLDGMLDILTADATTASHSDIKGVWVNLYRPNANPTIRELDAAAPGYNPRWLSGESFSDIGKIEATQSVDGKYLRLEENSSSEPFPCSVGYQMKILGNSMHTDQTLYVNARAVSGNDEAFYVYYSTDAQYYTLALLIGKDATSFANYSIRLPSSVAGKDIYIQFTDALNSTDSVQSSLEIEYVCVSSSNYGGYMDSVLPLYLRYRVNSDETVPTFKAVRAANIDGIGDGTLEVICAADGGYVGYDGTSRIGGDWTYTDANMYIFATGMTGISATLFSVADANGDDYSDVIIATTTVPDATQINKLIMHINLYMPGDPDMMRVTVKDFYAGMVPDQEEGTMVTLVVQNPIELG